MTISTRVREIVADLSGAMIETVSAETRLPEHDTSRDMADCPKCQLLAKVFDERWPLKDDVFRTVGDIIRFLEAREAGERG